jgi:DNA-binding phage protein
VSEVASETGVSRRELYEESLRAAGGVEPGEAG